MKWWQTGLVGLLFFGALALVGYFTVLSEGGPFAQQGKLVVLYFDHADGIKAGNRVTVLGVPSGFIRDVELVSVDVQGRPVPDDSLEQYSQKVAMTLELFEDVVFYEDYSASVQTESILGGKVVAINPGSATSEEDGEPHRRLQILSVSRSELRSAGMDAVEYQIRQRSEGRGVDLQGTISGDPIAGFADLMNENRDNIRVTMSNIAEITTKINHGRGTIGLLVNEDDLHRNATILVTDSQIVLRELREQLEDTREQAPVNSFIRAALTAF